MQPSFHSPLTLTPDDSGRNWTLDAAFSYDSSVGVITVPAGFVTDFASVPKLLWNVLPPFGRYGKAAIVHDYLYRTQGYASKPVADAIFLEAMKALGVPTLTRYVMFYAVRLFGGRSYKGQL